MVRGWSQVDSQQTDRRERVDRCPREPAVMAGTGRSRKETRFG